MAFKMKGSPMQRNFGIGTSFKQTDEDLKEYLIDEKGMTPKDADEQIADGAHSTSDEEFLAWYKENKKGLKKNQIDFLTKTFETSKDYGIDIRTNKSDEAEIINWIKEILKETIAQTFTLLGFFIAWLTLTGTAKDIVGIAIIISTFLWLLTIGLRKESDVVTPQKRSR